MKKILVIITVLGGLLMISNFSLVSAQIKTQKLTGCDTANDTCCLDVNNGRSWCNNGLSCTNGQCTAAATTTSPDNNSIQCDNGNGINTAIGCIPIDNQNDLIGFFLKWGIGIGGGIAFLLILVAGFQIMTSRGDPNRLKAGQELMTSAIAGLLLLIFSLVILRIIGVDILNIPGFTTGS